MRTKNAFLGLMILAGGPAAYASSLGVWHGRATAFGVPADGGMEVRLQIGNGCFGAGCYTIFDRFLNSINVGGTSDHQRQRAGL